MQQFRGMHVFERFEQLIHDILLVDALQYICSYDGMQVGFHIFKH